MAGPSPRLVIHTGADPAAWVALAEAFWKAQPMIQIAPKMRILLAVEPVDFRCGIDGLAALGRAALNSDPQDGTVFVFCARSQRAIK